MKHRFLPGLLSIALTLSLCAMPAAALETEDAKALLSTYYVDQIPEEVLEQGSVDAIIESLGDPYTVYMTAEEYQSFLSSVNGSTVVGVGVSISNLDSVEEGVGIEILSVLDNSPALEAGLSAGDYILAADGVALTSGTDASARISVSRPATCGARIW